MALKIQNFFFHTIFLWVAVTLINGCNSIDKESYGYLYRQTNTQTPQLWYCSAEGEIVNPGMPIPGLISGNKIIFQLNENDTVNCTCRLNGSRLNITTENGKEFIFNRQFGVKAAAPLYNTRFELSGQIGLQPPPDGSSPVWIGMDSKTQQLYGFGAANRFGCAFRYRTIFQNEYCITGRIRFFALGYEGTQTVNTEWEKDFLTVFWI